MIKGIILYTDSFKPREEFLDFIKSLGYIDYKSIECRTDIEVIEFIKQRYEHLSEVSIYKGEKTSTRMCGYLGFAYIENIETGKEFHIAYSNKRFNFVSTAEVIHYKDEYQWYTIND